MDPNGNTYTQRNIELLHVKQILFANSLTSNKVSLDLTLWNDTIEDNGRSILILPLEVL